jgi:FkbM family methyltransferase
MVMTKKVALPAKLLGGLKTILSLAEAPYSVTALLTWPKFSLTSYFMVSGLAEQGVLPATVLDVGANVGQFAVASAKLFPDVQVHSFEPVPECAERLRENVSGLGNIVVYPFALGETEGEVSFHVNAHSHSSSVLPLAQTHRDTFPDARETQVIRVKVSTLDRVFARTNFPSPILLKLDVQGYEAQTLRGAVEILKRVDYVVLETSFKPMYEGELLFMDVAQMMEEQGFQFERPVGWLAAPENGEILQMDALFARTDRKSELFCLSEANQPGLQPQIG